MTKRTITQKAELQTVVDEILSTLPQKDNAHVLALSGELGAGKTTFVQTLAQTLGVTEHVTSPTFVIMKKYRVLKHHLADTLVHIDAYRVEDVAEMRVLDLAELFKQKRTIICIEWPEHIAELIPHDALSVRFAITGNERRTISYGE